MLALCLRSPVSQRDMINVPNPYITSFLTFIGTVIGRPSALSSFERDIPWDLVVSFSQSIPRTFDKATVSTAKMINGSPLPEDWCMRGMEWVGRRVYERGFWKCRATFSSNVSRSNQPAVKLQSEQEVLASRQTYTDTQYLEPIEEMRHHQDDSAGSVTHRRWLRVIWALASIAVKVDGLNPHSQGPWGLAIDPKGELRRKMGLWNAKTVAASTQHWRHGLDDLEASGAVHQVNESTLVNDKPFLEDDDPQRQLKALSEAPLITAENHTQREEVMSNTANTMILKGFTILVVDTNILLNSLDRFMRLVTCCQWTVVVPLPGKPSPQSVFQRLEVHEWTLTLVTFAL